MPSTIRYCSYAKINLYLDVLRQRRDGYHNIETLFQTVSLADTLTFTEQASRITLVTSVSELESGESNLVYRAAALLKKHTGCPRGVHITLDKKIPIAAGLAGGSSNAAATLVALNRLWDLRLSGPALETLALELGSDVPFCTMGGLAAATGRGEQLETLPSLRRTWFLLLHPPVAVSTRRAYNSPALEHSRERPFAGKTRTFRSAIRALKQNAFDAVVFNRMETSVFAEHPQLATAKQELLDNGCLAAAMSGSGATLFGVCTSQKMAGEIAASFNGYQTSVVCNVPAGVECIQ